MVARDGLEPADASLFTLAPIRVYNDLTGLRRLRKRFKSRERRAYLGLESWAGCSRVGRMRASPEVRSLNLQFHAARGRPVDFNIRTVSVRLPVIVLMAGSREEYEKGRVPDKLWQARTTISSSGQP